MMPTERQIKILKFYMTQIDRFIPAKMVADHLDISVQTAKNDLKHLRKLSKETSLFAIETFPNKGSKIFIPDKEQFTAKLVAWEKQQQNKIDNKKTRINLMIEFLLNSYGYTSKRKLMDQFFIGETTLYNHMKQIKSLMTGFGLTLGYKTNRGYYLIGNELDKRAYLTKLGIDYKGDGYTSFPEGATKIYNIVADTFIHHKYHIDEEILQNITSHIFIAVQRMKHNHFIEEPIRLDFHHTAEFTIAKEILQQTLLGHRVSEQHLTNEATLLTQIILGKLDYINNDYLQDKVNDFINQAFEAIYAQFSINFETVDNLRLLLALHLIPLFYRIQSGTQLENPLEEEIHQSFPQAYDIALYFSILFEQGFDLNISKGEISYLALYFNYGIDNYLATSSGKKILIITSLRKSETILLRHKILNWFPNQIETMNFIDPKKFDASFNMEDFDAIFTTETNLPENQGGVTYISLFPSEKDYKKVNLAINGYNNLSSVLEKFDKNCFYYGKIDSKQEVLDIAIENAVSQYELPAEFADSVYDREEINSTYFGNKIAIPHTLSPISEETFVSVVALENEIKWDKVNTVDFVMLVSIAKNNPKEFQFWYYISSFVQDQSLIEEFRKDSTFETLMQSIKTSLKNKFN